MPRAPFVRALAFAVAIIAFASGPGCASKTYLMPTPQIYREPGWDPFAEVPPTRQSDEAQVLYVTDRIPIQGELGTVGYGLERSRSAAFGEATVRFGTGLTWERLVAASRTGERPERVEIAVVGIDEIARFAPTPKTLVASDTQIAALVAGHEPPPDPVELAIEDRFRAEVARRLADTPRKEVYLFVHGFDNSFDDAVLTCAQLWHFLGREGVPVAYTWPAGDASLRGYEYTLDSTLFTVYHFKRTLELLASCPGVERINVLAHSRGTAVATDGVRELVIAARARGDRLDSLKIGTFVLAAPDIDFDVAVARNANERMAAAADRVAVYVSDQDQALGLSTWLFGGFMRLGNFDPKLFPPSELAALRGSQRFQLIDARVKHLGPFGHSYFLNSPYVSSDLILLMRFRLPAGAEFGRPLGITEQGLWKVEDGYPGEGWTPPVLPR